MATFRKRDPYQWQAMVRKKGQPLQTRTSETRAQAEQWARAIEVETDRSAQTNVPEYGRFLSGVKHLLVIQSVT